ncbi:BnaA06g15360D [Brassica napus]|uniref:BnaA06g15360D protein n=1 Tax=Brassica napus TaxID=3708 RepID=A0A078F136_BRANA|nr:BnaA06g15360D [Brassica napus]
MEPPECPVCLQSYDGESTLPRVLSCGHTACEECLTNIPKKFPDTIRCPACTVLVKFPPQGPSALPKNIDLLRLFPSSSNPTPDSTRNSKNSSFEFVTRSWPDEFHAAWKDRVLLLDAVSVEREGSTESASSSRLCGCLNKGDGDGDGDSKVSLLRVGSFQRRDDGCDSVFEFSYLLRMISCLWGMEEGERDELDVIMRVEERGVSKVFGLWGDLKSGVLYLVGQKLTDFSLEEFEDISEDDASCLAVIGMQLCEALLSLHKDGIFVGCLSVSCVKFDEFGNAFVDLIELLETGRNVYGLISEETSSCSKPVLFELLKKQNLLITQASSECMVACSSDVLPVCVLLLMLLGGKQFSEELIESVSGVDAKECEEKSEDLLVFGKFKSMVGILRQCCCLDPQTRPVLTDLWKCNRELIMNHRLSSMFALEKKKPRKRKEFCLVLGELCRLVVVGSKELEEDLPGMESGDGAEEGKLDKDFVGRLSEGKIKSKDLRGHQDSVTGLAVGGGFLFSSSLDKNIHVWSLKDFSHVHTFKGHQDKVTALIYIKGVETVCVSGDGGGGIFVWSTSFPLEEQPLRKWYEPKDWRYSGIHALAYSEDGYVYSGSGDNTIKAWSLQDGKLVCTMTGHKSVVSTLVVLNGVLYSGSWDGTVRLWSLSDHSFLTVLGEETQGIVKSILSLAADEGTLVAAYQNGDIQIWRDDTSMKSMQIQSSAILSVALNGKWLFTGGWDRTVNIQELSGDEISLECTHVGSIPGSSVVTSLLYWEGKLFAGFADKIIKVDSHSLSNHVLLLRMVCNKSVLSEISRYIIVGVNKNFSFSSCS